MEQCFALQDFARDLHRDLTREREINRGRLDPRELRLKEEEFNGKVYRHNKRVEKLSEEKKRFSESVERSNQRTMEFKEEEDRSKEREEQLRKREDLVEWGFEQQEAVLAKANEKGISSANATIEQRILLQGK